MRTPAPAIILTAALLATLTACATADGSAACEPVIPIGDAPGYLDVSGDFGDAPEVDFPTPLITETAEQAVLSAGEGAPVGRGQIVDFQASLFDGRSGELITASAYDPEAAPLRRTAGSEVDILGQIVQCAQVGSRIAATATIEDVFGADQLDPQLGFENEDSVVIVIDVEAAYLAKATGAPRLGATGIPAVVTTPDGVPGVTIPDEAPPTDLRAHTLVEGSGETVAEGDRVVLHYTGLLWDTKRVFDSSWERGAASTFTAASFEDDENGIVPGLATGLIGQTVGSQVIVVIPPEFGYPEEQAPATVPAGSTMVFVVDILGIED